MTPHESIRRRFEREVGALGLPSRGEPRKQLAQEHAATLPSTVQRYLHFMGAIGRARDWSFRVGFRGELRKAPQATWLPCEGWQYDTSFGIAHFLHMQVSVAGALTTTVRGSYSLGRGRMQAKLLDLIPVIDERGPATDHGELVSYLDDALLFAPAMIVGPNTHWTPVDHHSFEVSLSDQEVTVRTRVHVDAHGAPVLMTTSDHYVTAPLTRGESSTHVDGWTVHEGRPVPSRVRTTWHLDEGAYEYAHYEFVGLEFDVG